MYGFLLGEKNYFEMRAFESEAICVVSSIKFFEDDEKSFPIIHCLLAIKIIMKKIQHFLLRIRVWESILKMDQCV